MHSPCRSHFQAALKVLRYLKGTTGLDLTFEKVGKFDLVIYTNFDYFGSLIDHWSTMGYCTMFGCSFVTWRNKKQSTVLKSSTQVKLTALRIEEMLWIQNILKDLLIS